MGGETPLRCLTSWYKGNNQDGFISTSGVQFLVMVATVLMYLSITLQIVARLFSRSRLALVAVAVPVALIYVGAFISAVFTRSQWSMNERLSSRAMYLGNITFVVVTWSCAALGLVYALVTGYSRRNLRADEI